MQPDAPTFFVDDCLGAKVVAKRLRDEGYDVRVLLEIVKDEPSLIPSRDAEDVAWLPPIARKGWIILTKDERIRRDPLERNALLNARAGAFFITRQSLKGEQYAQLLVTSMAKICKVCGTYERPFIATISPAGDIKVLHGQRRGGVRRS